MRTFVVTLLLVLSQSLLAQDLHSKKKKAIESFNQAKELSTIGNLFKSEELLRDALKRDKSFDEAILLLHQIYLRRDDYPQSVDVFGKYQKELEPAFRNRILSDQANYQYELGEYQEASAMLSSIEGEVYGLPKRITQMLTQSVEFSLQQVSNPQTVDFEELPQPINEFERQYFPSITLSDQLVFTVRENNGKGDENLFSSSYANGNWSKPESISSKINSDRNEGAASISLDGSTLVFTACNVPGNVGSCDLYISYFNADEWIEPELLPKEVNSPFWDSQPSLSRDGSELYFVSRRDGGFGAADIWRSSRTKDGWSVAENLGAEINTPYDDLSPYIYADGKTLFFASKGRMGLGGLDLFVSTNSNAEWQEPENLGYPINNAFDQVGYGISPQGWAYYSSSKENGRITLKRFRVPEEVIPKKKISLLDARVIDEETKELIKASVSVQGGPGHIGSSTIVASTGLGRFRVLETTNSALLKVEASNYLSRELTLQELKELPKNEVPLKPIKADQLIEFGVVNFDFGSAEIKPSSYPVLEGAVMTILNNQKLQIEIGGHTDAIGEGVDNMTLSEERAKSVYRYLIEKGVAKENLVFRGYGEDRPLNHGNTETERNQNRRIEFKVIGFLK
ncbi:OmpA family protein [Roseivirga sp. E12]|uniref:OmpA family protein n=1 Tax=Roseivirga sp. E12 TaxID=2819237 RepID=UPI001ABD2380|nr:OmpA family protein [Roseivirga sp. E12]MBO3700705.1 OmpA family protein [Roseivirga sp. E12]